MTKARRRDGRDRRRTAAPTDPAALARWLPVELTSFRAWHYHDRGQPTGLQDYVTALQTHLGTEDRELVSAVMAACGLTAGDWYRHMLAAKQSRWPWRKP
ncbi:hypothetical protein [Mycolicibacterium smegmatis]|uniref:Uncharacterized protein n=1 Tax=Mycolicibacterium smegmatis (strain MKD8) TaxID=1214915 RepID=A0A2U9PQ22_MYCSE|nr:hypothetical protein [Mycolicibacterium smegmatis]AWT53860.1 hypothetical protein D806_028860 [Mycolicibacterium smegmatis MKD8]